MDLHYKNLCGAAHIEQSAVNVCLILHYLAVTCVVRSLILRRRGAEQLLPMDLLFLLLSL